MKQLLRISWPLWAWKWTCSSSIYQAQASDQFLATNRAICLKTKKINKSKMDFRKFPATNNRYISVIPKFSTRNIPVPPPFPQYKVDIWHTTVDLRCRFSHRHSCVVPDIWGHVLVKIWGPFLGPLRRETR